MVVVVLGVVVVVVLLVVDVEVVLVVDDVTDVLDEVFVRCTSTA